MLLVISYLLTSFCLITKGLVLQPVDRGTTVNVVLNEGGVQIPFVLTNPKNSGYDESTSVTFSFESKPKGIITVESNVTIQEPEEGKRTFFNVTITANNGGGKVMLYAHSSDANIEVDKAVVSVLVMRYYELTLFSEIIGWCYFIAWSISFYPQILTNFKTKSVIGLNFDFLYLNVVGFALYSSFNIGLYFFQRVQDQYFANHPDGVNPVKLNDVIFSIHATCACIVTIIQTFIFKRGNQRVSSICKVLLSVLVASIVIGIILGFADVLTWLNFLYFCSYIKLFITLIKYVPQAYMNFQRKSTLGWSIGNVLLDFTGGFLSIGQMITDSYNHDDWESIFGDPTKFGLGLFSVLFDILFILQHYVWYRNARDEQLDLMNNEEFEENDNDEMN